MMYDFIVSGDFEGYGVMICFCVFLSAKFWAYDVISFLSVVFLCFFFFLGGGLSKIAVY